MVAETRFIEGRGSELMNEVFGPDFSWVGRDRKKQRARSGEGGIGILVRRGLGEAKVLKVSETSDSLWIELKMTEATLIIAGVYLSPEYSKKEVAFIDALEELQGDILEFQSRGRVIVMGDLNRRIGDLPTAITTNHHKVTMRRVKEDTTIHKQGKKTRKAIDTSTRRMRHGSNEWPRDYLRVYLRE